MICIDFTVVDDGDVFSAGKIVQREDQETAPKLLHVIAVPWFDRAALAAIPEHTAALP